MTLFAYSPQTDGTTADVADINTPFANVATVLNGGIDSTNITAAGINVDRLASSANPETRQRRNFTNYVVSGFVIPTSGTLSATIASGIAYVNGKETVVSAFPKTFTASKDTYVDLKDDGTYAFVEVANGATSGMTLTTNTDGSNALRIGKAVTSGAAVTTITQGQNADPIGNVLYPQGPGSAKLLTNPYKFSAYASVATAITAGFVPTKITFGTEEYDTGSNFDSVTNNRFTAPIAGFYQFSAQIQSGSGAANEFYNIYLYKNGSVYKSGTGHNSTIAGTVLESVSPPPMLLAANDYIEVYAAQNSAGAKNTVTGADKTYFGGYLVSIS
jgi:hypothetical protein